MENQSPNKSFTPMPPLSLPKKKGLSKKVVFALIGVFIVAVALSITLIAMRKPKKVKIKAIEPKHITKVYETVMGRKCDDPFEGFCQNWPLRTNEPGDKAQTYITIENKSGYRRKIWVQKLKAGCRGIKIICDDCRGTDMPMLHCPDLPDVPAEVWDEITEEITIENGQTIKIPLTAPNPPLEQLVDTNGECGSAQVDIRYRITNPPPPDDPNYNKGWSNVYWGIAYKTDANGSPYPCVSPTETPIPTEPPATPIPTETPIVTSTPTPTTVPTVTPTETPTPTATETPSPTATETPAPTPTATSVPTPTPTETPAPTATEVPEQPTITPTPTEIILAQVTSTPAPTKADEIPPSGIANFLKALSILGVGIILFGLIF